VPGSDELDPETSDPAFSVVQIRVIRAPLFFGDRTVSRSVVRLRREDAI